VRSSRSLVHDCTVCVAPVKRIHLDPCGAPRTALSARSNVSHPFWVTRPSLRLLGAGGDLLKVASRLGLVGEKAAQALALRPLGTQPATGEASVLGAAADGAVATALEDVLAFGSTPGALQDRGVEGGHAPVLLGRLRPALVSAFQRIGIAVHRRLEYVARPAVNPTV